MGDRCIILGSPRTGTTMLHAFLNLSPDIYIAFEKALYRTPELDRQRFVKRLMQKGKGHRKPSLGLTPRAFHYFDIHHGEPDYQLMDEVVPDDLVLAHEVTKWIEKELIGDKKIVGDKLPAYHKNMSNIVRAYDIKKVIVAIRDPKDIAFALRRPRNHLDHEPNWQENSARDAKKAVSERYSTIAEEQERLDELDVDCEIKYQQLEEWDQKNPVDVMRNLCSFLEVPFPEESEHYIQHITDPRKLSSYYKRESYDRSIDPNLQDTEVDDDFAEICEDLGYSTEYPDDIKSKLE